MKAKWLVGAVLGLVLVVSMVVWSHRAKAQTSGPQPASGLASTQQTTITFPDGRQERTVYYPNVGKVFVDSHDTIKR